MKGLLWLTWECLKSRRTAGWSAAAPAQSVIRAGLSCTLWLQDNFSLRRIKARGFFSFFFYLLYFFSSPPSFFLLSTTRLPSILLLIFSLLFLLPYPFIILFSRALLHLFFLLLVIFLLPFSLFLSPLYNHFFSSSCSLSFTFYLY